MNSKRISMATMFRKQLGGVQVGTKSEVARAELAGFCRGTSP